MTYLAQSQVPQSSMATKQLRRYTQAKQRQCISDNRPHAIQLKQLQQAINNPANSTKQLAENSDETPNNTGLPGQLKSGMENLSGMSLDHVRVHYNSSKPAAVQAHAYAQGSDIHVASGQERHLPHELGHVVQQAQGRVQPTTSVGGMAVNDNPALESEATVMGDKAMRGG